MYCLQQKAPQLFINFKSCYIVLPAADLAFNVALGATLVALPLTIGAITRSAFVNYKFTDKRVSVVTKAPWESEWLAGSGIG